MKHPFVVAPSSPRTRVTKSRVGTRAGENLIWFSTLGLLAACAQSTETTAAEAPAAGAGNIDIAPGIAPDLTDVNDDPDAVPGYENAYHLGGFDDANTEVDIDFALDNLFSKEEGLDVSTIDPSTIKVLSAPTGAGWNSVTEKLHVPQGTSGKVVVSVLDVATGEERLFAFDIAESDSPSTVDDSSELGFLPMDFLAESFDDFSQEFLDSLTAEQAKAIESGDFANEDFILSLTPSQLRLLLPGEEIVSEEPGQVITMDFSALSDESLELLLVLAFHGEAEEEFPLSPEEARDFLFDVLDTLSINGEGFLEVIAGSDQMRTEDLSQATWDSLEEDDTAISKLLLEMRESFLEFEYEGNLALNVWQGGHLEAGEEAEAWDIDLDPGTYRIFVQEHRAADDPISISPPFDGSRDWYNISISGEGAASKGPSLYFTTTERTDSGYYVDIVVDSQGQYEMTVDTSTDYPYGSYYSASGIAYPKPELPWGLPAQGYDIYIQDLGQDLGQDWRMDYTQRGVYAAHGELHHAYVDKKEVPLDFIFGKPVTADWKPRDEGMHVFRSIYSDGAGVVGAELNDAGSTMFGFTDAENHGISDTLDQGDIVEIVIDNFSSPFGDGGNVTVFGGAINSPAKGSITPIYTTSFSGTKASYAFEASQAGDIFVNVNASEFSSFDFSINYLFNQEDFGMFFLNSGGSLDLYEKIGDDVAGLELKGGSENLRVDANGILHTTSLTKGGMHELMLAGVTTDGVQVEYSFDLLVKPRFEAPYMPSVRIDPPPPIMPIEWPEIIIPKWSNPETDWKITRGEDFSIELPKVLGDDPLTYKLLEISESTLEFDPIALTLSGNYAGGADELTVRYNVTDGFYTMGREISLEVVEPESPSESPSESLILRMNAWTHSKIEFALDADEEPLDTDNPLELLVDGRVFETGYYDASSHSYVANVGFDAINVLHDGIPYFEIEIKTDSAGEFLASSTEYGEKIKFEDDAPSEFVSILLDDLDLGGAYMPVPTWMIDSPSVRELTGRTEAPDNYAFHMLDNNGIEKIYGIDDDLIAEEQNEYVEVSVTTYWETW